VFICAFILQNKSQRWKRLFPVRPEKEHALRQRMESLGIREDDLEEKFIRSSGHGGQKVNRSATCVYLRHIPTGADVKCQKTRSQGLNRYYARLILCDKIEAIRHGKKSKKQLMIEKRKKQKDRRRRRTMKKLKRLIEEEE